MDLVNCSYIMLYLYSYYNVKVQWEIEYFLKQELIKVEKNKDGKFDEKKIIKNAQRATTMVSPNSY